MVVKRILFLFDLIALCQVECCFEDRICSCNVGVCLAFYTWASRKVTSFTGVTCATVVSEIEDASA